MTKFDCGCLITIERISRNGRNQTRWNYLLERVWDEHCNTENKLIEGHNERMDMIIFRTKNWT